MPAPRKSTTQPKSNGTAGRLSVVKADEQSVLPSPPDGLLPESVEAWEAIWQMPQASSFQGAHRVVLLRWVKSLDQWFRSIKVVEELPLVTGSQGQPVANPLMSWVTSRETEMEKCERQLGVGLRNAVDLGVSVGQAKLTAAQLNAMTRGSDGAAAETKAPAAIDAEGWEAV